MKKQNPASRVALLKESLRRRVLVLDGATGTALQARNLTAEDFGGPDLEGCNENLVLTRPQVIEDITLDYLKAGCDIVETNTFGATPLVLDEYGLGSQAELINEKAAQIARRAADQMSTPEQPRFVAGSMGPTTKAISVTGGVTFKELIANYRIQAKGLAQGGVDYLLLETCQDTRNIKAALIAIDQVNEVLQREQGYQLPVAISGTIEPMGTMLGGQSIEALYASLAHRDLLYIGLNCATGPEFMTDHIRSLSGLSHIPIACVPNAGLPDEEGRYLETPEMLARTLKRFADQGWINVIGGCCGTHAGHIRALSSLAKTLTPRNPTKRHSSFLSGVDYLEITDEMRPVIVGERTNVIGSKKFKTLICEEKFEEASDIAKAQIKNGAQIIDLCLANPDRDELADTQRFMEFIVKKVRAPLMIDSTDAEVIAEALTYSQGKAIINSINLEDGEERFEEVLPLAKQFGAALVVGTIDDDPKQGMAISRERKLAVATRSYDLLTQKYGIPAEDIYWDPLVFPCATGDEQYVGSAVETIEGIRLIKEAFPGTRTILGISNVSFGLPAAGREVLNSVFLYHCVQAGLDLAIVNSEKLVRYAQLPQEEIDLSNNLLWNRGEDPIGKFAAHFREKKVTAPTTRASLPLFERLPRYIIEGSKDGLIPDLNEALQSMKPLEIINGPLMKGMDEVGRLFNSNQLIVAEVLQSAEAMKAAVAHLEIFMEKSDASSRGKILLATVKGDVHDIGKNLVEIILANNGFQIVNLGIKVPPEQLIAAIKEHKPDIVGLSGLLVKSAQQMVITAEDFSRVGIETPVLVGGAALSQTFVDKHISRAYTSGHAHYASDAMHGLELAKKVVDPVAFEKLNQEATSRRAQLSSVTRTTDAVEKIESTQRSALVPVLETLPAPPDFERHVIKNTPLETIWKFINPLMLYGRHLGIKGGVVRKLEKAAAGDTTLLRELRETEPKSLEIWEAVQDFKLQNLKTDLLKPRAVYQYFPAESEGNTLTLSTSRSMITEERIAFHFPRQKKIDGLCISDYVSPSKTGKPPGDSVALFVVTVGNGVREMAEELKNKGDYLRSHILQALALETAEAYAEFLHSQLRKFWGFEDPIGMTMMERFQAKYRGKRYSFGYPACPRLDDQSLLFDLLKPQDIGVQLTDGFMMDPEASVSAIVFHHPDATYFSVGGSDDNR